MTNAAARTPFPAMAHTPNFPPSRRLLLALSLSLLLHAAGIALVEWIGPAPQRPKPAALAALHATLLTRPKPPADDLKPAAEPVLKNTLPAAEPESTPAAEPQTTPAVSTADLSPRRPSAAPLRAAAEASARRKLAEHVFYPPEAVAQGIQGEVRLLVALDRKGNIVHAKVIVSSGHAVLDQAAVSAAYAIGRLPGAGALDLLLPVIFKLEEG